MFEIGRSLAEAREAHGLQLADAERITFLRARHLSALEQERFDDLPGQAYARAFLRTYARALGLDAERFVSEFDHRFGSEVHEFSALPPRFSLDGVRLKPLLGLVVVLAVIGGFVALALSTPAASPRGAKKVVVTRHHARHVPAHAVIALRPDIIAGPLPAGPPVVVVRARSGACWLLVRAGGPNGRVLYESTLEPGSSLRFASSVWLRLGDPAHVIVSRGGKVLRELSGGAPVDLRA